MRKNSEKAALYKSLKALKPAESPSNQFQKTTLKLPKLKNRSPNFLRVGCPTEILVHIPHHVGKLKQDSKTNTTQVKGSLKDLLQSSGSKTSLKCETESSGLLNEFDSLRVPIKSFAELKLPGHYFNLDSVKRAEEDEHLMKVMKKLNNKDMLKPLGAKAQGIKNSFLIKHELLFTPNKSPYFTSPFLFSRSSND